MSSLSRRNFCANARAFAYDMDIPFSDIRDGTDFAVTSISALTDVATEQLAHSALRRTGGRNFTLAGQELAAPTLRRHSAVVCPCCLVQDVETGRFGSELDMYQRSAWDVVHIRTCSLHAVPLLDLRVPANNRYSFDFLSQLAGRFDQIETEAKRAAHRKASDYEAYLNRRIAGERIMKDGWLDTLPFWLAAKLCEIIGALILFGRTPNLLSLTEHDWARAGSAGFDLVKHGVDALTDFLTHLQVSSDFTGGAGPKKWYGRMYEWLSSAETDLDLEPVRSVVRAHIVATAPVAAGEVVLGQVVTERRVHSVFSASRTFGIHTLTIRKILAAVSLLPANYQTVADNQLTFAAEAAEPLLRDIAAGIQPKQIVDYLSMTRTQVKTMKGVFFRPILEHPGIEPLYRKTDLDRFMARLLEGAVAVESHSVEHDRHFRMSIAAATARANCKVHEVVQLILERRLSWIGRDVSLTGFASVMVDLQELKLLVRLPPLDGIPRSVFADSFGISDGAATQLIVAGLITGTLAVNPINRCPITIVTTAVDVELRKELVSLRDLARDRNISSRRLRRELAENEILPIPDWLECGAIVYRRQNLVH